MHAALIVLQDNGLTFSEVIRDIPHDAGAFIAYALMAGFIVLVWRGSRQGSR